MPGASLELTIHFWVFPFSEMGLVGAGARLSAWGLGEVLEKLACGTKEGKTLPDPDSACWMMRDAMGEPARTPLHGSGIIGG